MDVRQRPRDRSILKLRINRTIVSKYVQRISPEMSLFRNRTEK